MDSGDSECPFVGIDELSTPSVLTDEVRGRGDTVDGRAGE